MLHSSFRMSGYDRTSWRRRTQDRGVRRADRRETQGGSRRRRRDILGDLLSSTAIAACSRTAATTSTTSRQHATFEEVCYLLWHRRLPTRAELGDLQSQLAAARRAAGADPAADASRCRPCDGMDALRTLTSALGHYDPEAADSSPQAQLPQGGAPDRADRLASSRRGAGCRPAAGSIEPDPALGHAANFLYMLTGERPHAARDPRVRRRADPARRSRAERVDVRRARRGGDAHRHLLGDRRRDRHAQGAAARRRQRRRHEDAARDRRDGAARARRRGRRAKLARKEKISGLRPPRVPDRGSARDAPAADVARPRQARRPARLVRDVAAHRGARQGREEAESRTSTSTRPRRTTRSASRSISTRRSSPSAASPAGRRTSSSSTRTTG